METSHLHNILDFGLLLLEPSYLLLSTNRQHAVRLIQQDIIALYEAQGGHVEGL